MSYEERDNGYLFRLRNNVRLLVKWHSPKQLEVEIWNLERIMPSDTGNLLSSSFREKLAKAAQEYFGKSKVPHIAEDIGEVAVALNSPLSNGQTMRSALSEKAGPSIAERLVLYARKAASFFHTPEREAYATVEIGQHTETYPVRSRHFKLWLQSEF